MPEAWDTTTAARLRPDSLHFDYVQDRRRQGDPIAFTATTLTEIFHGLHKAVASGRSAARAQHGWLRDQIDSGLIDVLVFDERAADIAGALRARSPIPPSTARRPRGRSKADNRVAWIFDIQIAATAFAHGYDLVAADAHHLTIAERLGALAPAGPGLRIQAPPQL